MVSFDPPSRNELMMLINRTLIVNVNHQQAKFTSVMTNLRQIANHPLSKLDDRGDGAEPNFEDIVNLSGKMMLLDRLLPELFKRGHKVSCSFPPLFRQFRMLTFLPWDVGSHLLAIRHDARSPRRVYHRC